MMPLQERRTLVVPIDNPATMELIEACQAQGVVGKWGFESYSVSLGNGRAVGSATFEEVVPADVKFTVSISSVREAK